MREILVDPHKLAQVAPDGQRVFLGGARTPPPAQRAWLHQLLGRLPSVERVIMHLKLQEWSQREIAREVGMTQPAVCYRLRIAQRRLRLLAKLPRPAVTLEEAGGALRSARDPSGRWLEPRPEDPEILVRSQRMRFWQLADELGIDRTLPGQRVRAMRVMVVPEAPRVRGLIDLLVLEQAPARIFETPRWNPRGRPVRKPLGVVEFFDSLEA